MMEVKYVSEFIFRLDVHLFQRHLLKNCLCFIVLPLLFVKDLCILMWALCLVVFIYLSVLLPVLHCLDYCSFVEILKLCSFNLPTFSSPSIIYWLFCVFLPLSYMLQNHCLLYRITFQSSAPLLLNSIPFLNMPVCLPIDLYVDIQNASNFLFVMNKISSILVCFFIQTCFVSLLKTQEQNYYCINDVLIS